jgi:sigma-B regulation protein RsbU (phosphoserine phosphatase)
LIREASFSLRRGASCQLTLSAFVLCAALCIASNPAVAQTSASAQGQAAARTLDATNLHQPLNLANWLVAVGDDQAYSEPGFDDSDWLPFDASKDSLHTLFPNVRPEVVWYRLHIKVRPDDTGLALQEYFIGPAFELYSNGVKLIEVGRVAPVSSGDPNGRLVVGIPADQIASGSVVLALRVHLSNLQWSNAFPGYYYYNLTLGEDAVLQEHTWLQTIGTSLLYWLEAAINLLVVLGALLLYSAQRRQTEYLWLLLWKLALLIPVPLGIYVLFHTFPMAWHTIDILSAVLAPYFFTRTYLAFIGRPIGRWLHGYVIVASVLNGLSVTHLFAASGSPVEGFLEQFPALLLISLILPAILISQIRKGNRDAGILLIPLLLDAIYAIVYWATFLAAQIPAIRLTAWTALQTIRRTHLGPFVFQSNTAVSILSSLALALIILLRSNRLSRRQAVIEGELAAAREVQRVILPESVESVPGFNVESVYQPDQQVGGDFFQVIPDGRGGLLVVVGDVAGKGLPAAMLVSVLVGAIRTAASYTNEPNEILSQLNDRLIGRTEGGFSTALAAHITADGTVSIASAGHLFPYVDGRELELPGALPLGIVSGVRYETSRFTLRPASRMTFYSDGVVEARNREGELFGFDRGRTISNKSAADIVEAARRFGQADDITVVAIERAALIASAA